MSETSDRSGRKKKSSEHFDSTIKGAAALFGSVTGGVAGVYLLTLSVAVTTLAVVAAVLILLVLRLYR